MKKIIALLFIVIVLPIATTIPTAQAYHSGIDGSCSAICAAENECGGYVAAIKNETIFYLVIKTSNDPYVQDFCVFGQGLLIT